jgi:aspartokinase-like uncharacterized kinase
VSAPEVVKIGGSLAESGAAAALLRGLAARQPRRLIVVPGGGEFADAVRRAQRRQAFGEPAAHHMALLAMHMSAVMLAAFMPGGVVAETREAFESAWRRNLTPIWAPERMALAAPGVPASWEVTSDSLAAWLAAELGALRLLVVKSCPVPDAIARDAPALAAAGIVDARFPEFVAAARFAWRVVSGADAALRALDA